MKLISIQYLRAFAALTVIIFHARLQLERFNYDTDLFFYPYLHFGIDIFFVMSGFLMWVTTRKPVTPGGFFLGRLIRVAPLYWLATTFVLVLALLMPSALQSTQLYPDLIAASYLFIPWYNPAQHGALPLFVVGWTLNLEVFFYLVYAIALYFRPRARLLFSLVAFTAIALIGLLPQTGSWTIDALTTFRAAEFGVGIGVGYLYSDLKLSLPRPALIAMIAGGIAMVPLAELVLPAQVLHDYMLLIGATLLIFGTIIYERDFGVRNIGWMVLVGDATYSIYLVHPIVLSALGQVIKRSPVVGLPGFPVAFTALGIVVSIGAGLIAYFGLERPIASWMIRLFAPPRRTFAPAE